MSKTLKNTKRQDKEQLKAIRFTQNSIPLEQFYEDGIFLIQSGKSIINTRLLINCRTFLI